MRQNRALVGVLLAVVAACGDAGSGGSGAAGGAGGAAGGTGGDDVCAGVDCNDNNPCTQDVCDVEGACLHPAAVVVTLMQVDGDCAESVCDGTQLSSNADSGDIPIDDGNECTEELCTGGVPQHTPVADGTACGMDGSCAAGLCEAVTCEADADCLDAELDQCLAGACVDCDDTGGCTAPETCDLGLNLCE